MAFEWAKIDFKTSDRLKAQHLNDLGNSIRNWLGDVNGGGNHLTNVILEAPLGFRFYVSPVEVTPGADGRSITQYDQTVSINQLARWATGRDSVAEGGGNSGSDFFISRYNDAGTLLGSPFTIRRSDGLITMGPQKWTGAIDAGGQTLSNVVIAGMMTDPTTTKGDLITRTATALARVPIGTDGSILTADAAQTNGMRWTPNLAVPNTRQVIAGAGLTGGGALTADVTLTASVVSVFGRTGAVVLTAADVTGVGGVLNTRTIIAGAGLTGGGNLTADVTLVANVTSVFGRTGTIVLTPTDISGAGGVPATRQIITGPGLTGGGDLSGDRTLSIVPDTMNQQVRVSKAGLLIGTRREINFIEGSNITLTPVDNSGSNRLDLTISTMAAQMSIFANSALVGQTQSLNLNAGANVVISGTMNSGRADITITAAGGGSGGMIDPTQAAGDLIVRSSSTTVRFPASTTDNWVLTADSAQPLKMKWALAQGGITDPTTAEGDLLVRSATAVTKLPIGSTTGMVLTVDTLIPTKVKWATPAVASQSPWLTNIDGGGNSLSNVNTITAGLVNTTTGYQVNGVPLVTGVSSVFGRSGAVVAVAGDYDVSKVTNAVSDLGSYANPAWITSLAWSKITGAPTFSQTPWLSDIDGAGFWLKNAGRIGVGTSAPMATVDVNGSIRAMGNLTPASGAGLEMVYTGVAGYVQAYDRSSSAYKPLNINGAGLTINGQGNSIVLQPAGGNVGIGVDPGSVLHLGGNGAVDTPLGVITMSRLWGGASNTRASAVFHYYSSGVGRDMLAFGVSGDGGALTAPGQLANVKMVVTAAGNVGIGTFNAPDFLTIGGVSYAVNAEGGIRIMTTGAEIQGRVVMRFNSAGFPRLAFDGPKATGVAAEAFCVDWANLNVGIGRTTTAYKLDVAGDVNCTGAFRVNGSAINNPQILTGAEVADGALAAGQVNFFVETPQTLKVKFRDTAGTLVRKTVQIF